MVPVRFLQLRGEGLTESTRGADHSPRYRRYVGHPPGDEYSHLSKGLLGSFFDWWLNQRRGKKGRKLRGTKKCSSLGKYWKDFRLVYERATGDKIDPLLNRQMHKVGLVSWASTRPFPNNHNHPWSSRKC